MKPFPSFTVCGTGYTASGFTVLCQRPFQVRSPVPLLLCPGCGRARWWPWLYIATFHTRTLGTYGVSTMKVFLLVLKDDHTAGLQGHVLALTKRPSIPTDSRACGTTCKVDCPNRARFAHAVCLSPTMF